MASKAQAELCWLQEPENFNQLPDDGFIELTTIETEEEPNLVTDLSVSSQNRAEDDNFTSQSVPSQQGSSDSFPCAQADPVQCFVTVW